MQEIRDCFIKEQPITLPIFVFFERMLRQSGNLLDRPDDVIWSIIQPLILEPEVTKLLLKNRIFYLQLLEQSSDKTVELFVRSIRDAAEADSARETLREWGDFLDENLYGPIRITTATYASIDRPEQAADVTDLIIQKVERDRLLHASVTNDAMGGDPDPGSLKRLTIVYRWRDSEFTQEPKEWEYWRLPNG